MSVCLRSLSESVIAGVFSFSIIFLDILVRRKSDPQVLPSFILNFEAKCLAPSKLAIKVTIINSFRLWFSSLFGRFWHNIITFFKNSVRCCSFYRWLDLLLLWVRNLQGGGTHRKLHVGLVGLLLIWEYNCAGRIIDPLDINLRELSADIELDVTRWHKVCAVEVESIGPDDGRLTNFSWLLVSFQWSDAFVELVDLSLRDFFNVLAKPFLPLLNSVDLLIDLPNLLSAWACCH